jgi:hypothetical protein
MNLLSENEKKKKQTKKTNTKAPKPYKDSEKDSHHRIYRGEQKLHSPNGWEKSTSTGTHHGGTIKKSIALEGLGRTKLFS